MARTCSLGLALLVAGAACCLGEQSEDAPLPSIERMDVVVGQGFFPVAMRLQDGRIAVVLRGGAGHLGIQGRLDIVFSDDEGKTWTGPSVVNDSPVDDRNPALGQATDGTLVVGFDRTAASCWSPAIGSNRTACAGSSATRRATSAGSGRSCWSTTRGAATAAIPAASCCETGAC